MKAKICNFPSCSTLIEPDKRYCNKHMPEKRVPFEGAIRSNAQYYNTTKWRSLRKKVLKDQPYCSKCGIDSNLHIHHRIPARGDEELFFNEDNLTVLCEGCHRVVTAKEINKRS